MRLEHGQPGAFRLLGLDLFLEELFRELGLFQPLFPGESEIDQLYVIQKALGPLTA